MQRPQQVRLGLPSGLIATPIQVYGVGADFNY